MKSFLLIICSVFCAVHLYGQAQKTELVLAKADTLYDAANDDYYDGNYQEAERGFLQLRSYLESAQLDTVKAYAKTTWKIGRVYDRLRKPKEALTFYAKAEEAYKQLNKIEDLDLILADIQMDRGQVYSQMQEPQRALRAFDSSLVVYRTHFGDQHETVANTLMNSALDLMRSAQYYDAEKRLLSAFDIFKEVSDSTSVNFNRIYSNLGYLYRKRGDYNRALLYGEKALKIKLLNYGKDHPSVSKYHSNIGKSLIALDREKEAIPYFKEAYRIANASLGPNHSTTIGTLGELGDVYADNREFKKAMEIYSRTGEMLENVYPPTHPYRVAYTFNVGMLHEDKREFPLAIDLYKKAIRDLLVAPEPLAILIANAEKQLAQVYLKAGDTEQCLVYVEKGLERLAPDLVKEESASTTGVSVLQAESSVLDLLELRAEAYAQRANKGDTLRSLQTVEIAVTVIKNLRKSFPSEEARQYLREEVDDFYTLGVLLAHRLYQRNGDVGYLRRALALSDAAKSGMLKDNIREQQARRLAGVSEAEIEQIEQLESELRDKRAANSQASNQVSIDQVENAAIAFQEAETELRRKYENYAFLKGFDEELILENIQNKISKNEAFVDYVIVDQQCFVTLIQPNSIHGFELKLKDGFYEELSSLVSAVRTPNIASVEEQRATVAGLKRLYQTLFNPLQPSLKGTTSLLISPWGVLHQLPFAALVKQGDSTDDYRKLSYLINEFSVGYQSNVSALLLSKESTTVANQTAQELLGVAPTFRSSRTVDSAQGTRQEQLASLPFTTVELSGISGYFKSRLLEGVNATEASFVGVAQKYRMLHLASHARLDDREPLSSGIYFASTTDPLSDDFLSAAEIYGLDLSADLAVLSACNTGAGRLQSGEGVLSLAHAFQYAGCKSVVASSWLANDQSTADITTEFYAQLAEGLPKNEALRKAKLHYLETADALSAHPFFWAGLTLRGDVGAIEQGSNNWWIFAVGLSLLGLGLLYFRRKG